MRSLVGTKWNLGLRGFGFPYYVSLMRATNHSGFTLFYCYEWRIQLRSAVRHLLKWLLQKSSSFWLVLQSLLHH